MTDISSQPDPEEETIDAEFEPAQASSPRSAASHGPGWLSFGFLAVFCLLISLLSAPLLKWFSPFLPTETGRSAPLGDQQTQTDPLRRLQQTQNRLENAQTSLQSELTALASALQQAEADINTLRAGMTEPQDPPKSSEPDKVTGLIALSQRVSELEVSLMTRIERIAASVSEAGPAQQDMTALTRLIDETQDINLRLLTLQQEMQAHISASQAGQTEALARLAFFQIETSAASGMAFPQAYEQLRRALPDHRETAALAPFAARKVPSWSALETTFSQLAEEALALGTAEGDQTPAWLETLFGSGIKVRQTGAPDITPVLTTIQQALGGPDPSTALDMVNALTPDLQKPFTDWLQDAQARQTLDDLLIRLERSLLAEDFP